MKQFLKDAFSGWGLLPKELKVVFYYAGAAGLNLLAEALLNMQPIDWNSFFRVLVGNMIVVFLKEAKPRIDRIRK